MANHQSCPADGHGLRKTQGMLLFPGITSKQHISCDHCQSQASLGKGTCSPVASFLSSVACSIFQGQDSVMRRSSTLTLGTVRTQAWRGWGVQWGGMGVASQGRVWLRMPSRGLALPPVTTFHPQASFQITGVNRNRFLGLL